MFLFLPIVTRIPPIAEVCGIAVGRNGRDRLARIYGEGAYSVGGHPDGMETWVFKNPSSRFSVEGFSFTAHEGEVIEWLDWTSDVGRPGKIPVKRFRSKGWLGEIVIGMPEKQALAIAEKKLGKGKFDSGAYEWTQTGWAQPADPNAQAPFTKWEADLSIKDGRVSEIQINCH